ncbi:MAG: hypothetical protein ACRC7O_05175, partial [Fimbriiglobus sp.]
SVAYNLFGWSSARSSRVSTRHFETGQPDVVKDMKSFNNLIKDVPRHASPTENPAFAGLTSGGQASNFDPPWCQFRKLIPIENVLEFEASQEDQAAWNVPEETFSGVPGVDW